MTRRVVVHRFGDSLAYSAALDDEPAWVAFYKRVWPDAHVLLRVDHDGAAQRHGIDREIILPNGRRFTVDEKKRKDNYPDLLLEVVSRYVAPGHPDNRVGWTIDPHKRCDYVAYAIVPAARVWLLPTELLRQATHANKAAWRRRFGIQKCENPGYMSVSIPVPWPVLADALCDAMVHPFDGAAVTLPTPLPSDNPDLVFAHDEPAAAPLTADDIPWGGRS